MIPEDVFPLIFFSIVFAFVIILTMLSQRHKLKMRKLELGQGVNATSEIQEDIEQLQLEIDVLKRTISKQQKALEDAGSRIELTPYEREQLKIDQNDKFTF